MGRPTTPRLVLTIRGIRRTTKGEGENMKKMIGAIAVVLSAAGCGSHVAADPYCPGGAGCPDPNQPPAPVTLNPDDYPTFPSTPTYPPYPNGQ